MTTNFRALISSMADELDYYRIGKEGYDTSHPLAAEARLALAAEPEPPNDEEVAELVAWLRDRADSSSLAFTARRITRAAELLERLAPEPVPEGPTDEELTLTYAYAVAAALGNKRGPFKKEDAEAAQLAGLRAALARWGQP